MNSLRVELKDTLKVFPIVKKEYIYTNTSETLSLLQIYICQVTRKHHIPIKAKEI